MNRRALLKLWAERDRRYALGRKGGPLTPSEIDSIKAYRLRETADLSGDDRLVAAAMVGTWKPPTPMEF